MFNTKVTYEDVEQLLDLWWSRKGCGYLREMVTREVQRQLEFRGVQLDQTHKDVNDMVTQMNTKLASEAFIDDIINRIRKKQL